MSLPLLRPMDYRAYLALEREVDRRHEFLDGEVRAMSGGSLRHSALKANLTAVVGTGLRGGSCRTYDADARLRTVETGLATYADLAVVCGPVVTHPEDPNAFTNPTALFEVLSPSTEAWDRGGKFIHAQQIPSLRYYVLLSQAEPRIEVYERHPDGWRYTTATEGDVRLAHLGLTLPVPLVYAELPDS
jgi:Uma2 family endonuclease